jgi:rRNA maturation endonuclease Nob1
MTATRMLRKLIDPADPDRVEEFYQNFRPTIRFGRALLCLDCDSIFEAEGTQKCPACGSTIAWAIGRALSDRKPQSAAPH